MFAFLDIVKVQTEILHWNQCFCSAKALFMPYPRLEYGIQRLLVRTMKSYDVGNVIYCK